MIGNDPLIPDVLVTPALKQHFDEFGYVVVEGILDEAMLRAIEDDYTAALDRLVEGRFAAGKLSSRYADLPFGRRLIQVIGEGVNWAQHFDISLPQGGITHDTPIHTTEAMFNVLTHPRLLDAVEASVGPEITSNPSNMCASSRRKTGCRRANVAVCWCASVGIRIRAWRCPRWIRRRC